MPKPSNVEDVYALTPPQQGILYQTLHSPGASVYFEQLVWTLLHELDVDVFHRAWQRLVERHAILRTAFLWEGLEEPVQVVHRKARIPLKEHDWRHFPTAQHAKRLQGLLASDRRLGFDLAQAPLMRLTLVRLQDAEYRFVWSHHHLLLDGWCLPILLRELTTLYEALCHGREPDLDSPAPFRDYVAWLQEQDLTAAETFWRRQLAGFVAPTSLGVERLDPDALAKEEDYVEIESGLLEETTTELGRFAARNQLSMNTLVQAAWAMLLSRYSGSSDVVFGVVLSGRPPTLAGSEAMIGPFINTVPMRVRLSPQSPLLPWLVEIQSQTFTLLEHDHPGLPRIRGWSEVPRELPLFESLVSFQNYPDHAGFRAHRGEGLELQGLSFSTRTGFPLSVLAGLGSRLSLRISYDRRRFDAATVERLQGHLQNLLVAMAGGGHRLGELSLLGADERHQLLALAGGEEVRSQPSRGRLHELFHEQAQEHPGAPAVVCDGESLSYSELDARSSRLAHALRARGIGPEVPVAVHLDRSLEFVVAVVAVLKAGGVYVPLDPDYPSERLSFLLEDTGAPWVITRQELSRSLPQGRSRSICLDRDSGEIGSYSSEPPVVHLEPDALAYVIYTSGSTGRPKGVAVTHANVVRLFEATQDWFQFHRHDVWTLFHSFAFDFSVWEMWGALLYGGKLVVVPYKASRSPAALDRLCQDHGVTVLNQTPSAFQALVDWHRRSQTTSTASLRWIIFGGEALNFEHLAPWVDQHGDRTPRLVNMYGITETTVHVTYRPVSGRDVQRAGGRSLIGAPLPDIELHILDAELRPVPLGVVGEVFVGGAGLARGYLRRPALTAERFIPHPTSRRPGERLYRSGDLGRRLPNGDVEHLGRIDQQVKIRGFRIELGEIEATLGQHPGVRQAVVGARREDDGASRLVAYLVPAPDYADTPSHVWRHFLAERLPSHMVPAAFVTLAELPLTSQGKVDWRALPAPGEERPELEEEFVAPSQPTQMALAEIWEQVLGLDRVGVRDNFFSLGGDSMRIVQILAQAQERGLGFAVEDLLDHPTVAGLAAVIDATRDDVAAPVQGQRFALISKQDREALPQGLEDAYPITRMQSGMLFHSDYTPESVTYHDVFSYHIQSPLDLDALVATWRQLSKRHPVLRTSFDLTRYSEPLQLVHASCEVPVDADDLSALDEHRQEAAVLRWVDREKQHKFDWGVAPLVRVRAHRRDDARFQMTLSFHHAIFDGWSVASLLNEFSQIYPAFLNGTPSTVEPPPRTQFRDFVALELESMASEQAQEFWRRKLSDLPGTELPRPLAPVPTAKQQSQMRIAFLPDELAADVQELARAVRVPLKSVLVAAHLRVLSLFTGQQDLVTGLGSNGRPETADGERVLGVLLNVLPFRMRLERGSWMELIQRCFEAERQLLPFRRFPLVEMQRITKGEAIFSTVFNYTHFHVLKSTLGGEREVQLMGRTFFQETNFALVVFFDLNPTTHKLSMVLEHDPGQVDSSQAQALEGYYQCALKAIVSDPFGDYDAASLLSQAERQRLLHDWNVTSSPYPRQAVHELFEDVARRAPPHHTAVVWGETGLTYGDLNARANQWARYLRRLGVGRETPVGLLLEPGIDVIVVILGILKAGGTYVPFDQAHPEERLAFLLDDSRAPVVVTQESLASRLPKTNARVLCLESAAGDVAGESRDALASQFLPGQLAYTLYTSGSTGRPKGVEVPQHAVVRLVRETNYIEIGPEDRVAHVFSPAFDAATFEIWIALLNGARLVGIPKDVVLSPARFENELRRQGVTVVLLTTALFNQMVREAPRMFQGLRYLMFGGEAVDPQPVRQVLEEGRPEHFLHCYGPTESTAYASFYPVREVAPTASTIPIGKPVANTTLYVLDEDLRPVPVGVTGELCIGGDGLARGYSGHPALTAEKFVPHPFVQTGGERLYRTGDLARFLASGDVEFQGRVDHQVKMRGFRIELGEIESVLADHAAVRESVVVMREDRPGDKRLVAYVVQATTGGEGRERLAVREQERVKEWHTLYDDLYTATDTAERPDFNIAGWNSSATGDPLPEEHMREWVDATVDRIRALEPRRVLEIGCGTGLLLFRLAPGSERYVGTDFSAAALSYIRRHLSREQRNRVALEERLADDFSDLEPRSFDTVVLNSVVQYFPSVEYLLRVLEGAVETVGDGGVVFLGDLRNYDLLEAFHTWVQCSQAPTSLGTGQFQQRVHQRMAQEQELLVSPAFFLALEGHLPRVTRVDVHLKRAVHRNELAAYRYEVMLHVGRKRDPWTEPEWLDWVHDELSLDEIHRHLKTSSPECLAIDRVPNARVLEPVELARRMSEGDGLSVGELAARVRAETGDSGVDPQALVRDAVALGYEVDVSWSLSRRDGSCAVLLRRPSLPLSAVAFPARSKTPRRRSWSSYANHPLQGRFATQLVPELKSFLHDRLPDYMVPASFVLLAELPLTPNGKVHRQALPMPDWGAANTPDAFVAPRTEVERELARIWSEVLGVEDVGVEDNFFELGGDSILSIQIVARAHEASLRFTAKDLFDQQTIAKLIPVVEVGSSQRPEQGPVSGPVPLTPIQRWFFEQDVPHRHHFNQAFLLQVGIRLDEACLEAAWNEVQRHHDGLRMSYSNRNGVWHQEIPPGNKEHDLEGVDLSALPAAQRTQALETQAEEFQASLDLEQGDLCRIVLFELGPDAGQRLLIVIHHLAVDGVSWRILLEDLATAYRQTLAGQPVTLPPKTTSFQAWAKRLSVYAQSQEALRELEYWRQLTPAKPLPVDFPEGSNSVASTQTVTVSLDPAETRSLLQDVPGAYNTQINDVLLAALLHAFYTWTGDPSLALHLEGHGREELFGDEVDLTRTVGWFTSMFPVHLTLPCRGDVAAGLKSIKEQLRRVPRRGVGYGVLRYMTDKEEIQASLRPLDTPEVSFNYLGSFEQMLSGASLWRPAPESSGPPQDATGERGHLLEIMGRVVEGRLWMTWIYSRNLHHSDTVQQLGQSFLEHLRAVIAHCLSPDAGGYTPSDFPDVAVSQTELDGILAELDPSQQ